MVQPYAIQTVGVKCILIASLFWNEVNAVLTIAQPMAFNTFQHLSTLFNVYREQLSLNMATSAMSTRSTLEQV